MSNQEIPREEWIETLDSRVNELLDRGEVSKAQVIFQALLPIEQVDIFSDLDEEEQEAFVMCRVPVEVILAAQRPELLEMFRKSYGVGF